MIYYAKYLYILHMNFAIIKNNKAYFLFNYYKYTAFSAYKY